MSSVVHELPAVSASTPAKHLAIRQIQMSATLPGEFSSTPGGTIFSTTPGGTRIIYDRAFLLQCRESPVARTPPSNLPMIPGVTCPKQKKSQTKASSPQSTNPSKSCPPKNKVNGKSQGVQPDVHSHNNYQEDSQFHMDL